MGKHASLGGLVHVGLDVLSSQVSTKTNKLLFQTGDVVKDATDADSVESIQHVGFCSRPSKPKAGKSAAQCVVLKTSDRDIAIASQDIRALDLYGNLDHGETCMYGAGPDCTAQGRVLIKSDGGVTIFTTSDNTEAGASVYFRVAPDAFQFVAPWGTVKFDATGFHVLHASGANLHLGGIYGMPAPLDQISSYIKLGAGTVQAESSAMSHGVGPKFPLANSDAVIAALTSLQAQINAIALALPTIAAATSPSTATAALPVTTAVTGGATTVASAIAITKTTTCSTL